MRTYLDCIPCFFRQGLEAIRMVTKNEEKQRKVLLEIAKALPELPVNSTPPEMGRIIHKIVRQLANSPDPYREIKTEHNRIALQIYPALKDKVEKAKDKLLMAIKIATAGNVIDLGAKGKVNIKEEIEEILRQNFSIFDYEKFKDKLKKTDKILYIADNSGEIVFDRILIENLGKEVIYAVREKPIINDATIEDALFCGIDKVAKVISSGSDAPGTIISECSKNFLSYYEKAKLIISKGQGNYETLSEEKKPIFFLLKAKCPVIARDIGCEPGDIILKAQDVS